jgi:60 kDa SS-A/Ro ribonucleoprotein
LPRAAWLQEPTGKRFVIGIDVSASMSDATVLGLSHVTAREAVCALTMCLDRSEGLGNVHVMAFSKGLIPLKVEKDERLDSLTRRTAALPFSSTDCSLPMTWALKEKIEADCFVVLTDNETNCGEIHPHQALKAYRAASGCPDAKLIVLAVSTSSFTIADPSDPGMLDIAGLDSAVPRLVSEFVMGKL